MLGLGLAASDPCVCVLVSWPQASLCDLHRSVFTSVTVGEDIYLLLVCHRLHSFQARCWAQRQPLVSFQVLVLARHNKGYTFLGANEKF